MGVRQDAVRWRRAILAVATLPGFIDNGIAMQSVIRVSDRGAVQLQTNSPAIRWGKLFFADLMRWFESRGM